MNTENPQNGRDAVSTEDRHSAGSPLRRRILIVLACMVVFAAVAIPLVNHMEREDETENAENLTYPDAKYDWGEADFDYDIMQDEEYLKKNRVVMYEILSQGVSTSLNADNVEEYGEAVTVLYNMIQYIICGDTDSYNRLFTSSYLKENGEQERFSMQQLYDIKLTRVDSEQVTENGKTVNYQKFYVEYKIRSNNGTYRKDIGDDESRKRVVTLCDRDDGKMLIDQVGYVQTKA